MFFEVNSGHFARTIITLRNDQLIEVHHDGYDLHFAKLNVKAQSFAMRFG